MQFIGLFVVVLCLALGQTLGLPAVTGEQKKGKEASSKESAEVPADPFAALANQFRGAGAAAGGVSAQPGASVPVHYIPVRVRRFRNRQMLRRRNFMTMQAQQKQHQRFRRSAAPAKVVDHVDLPEHNRVKRQYPCYDYYYYYY